MSSYSFLDSYKIRWWLIGILLILPFQDMLGNKVSQFINYLDEITIVIFTPLALFKLYRERKPTAQILWALLIPITVFVFFGFIGGFMNGNALHVTVLGIFDYVKNFFAIIVYFTFFTGIDDFKKIFRFLVVVAVAIGAITMVQELWALISRYILGKDITEQAIYILTNLYSTTENLNMDDFNAVWRFGIYKALFVFINSNILGMYSLLFFTLYLFMNKKRQIAALIPLFSGIFVSVSRMAYLAFALMFGIYLLRARNWVIISSLAVLIVGSVIHIADTSQPLKDSLLNESTLATYEGATIHNADETLDETQFRSDAKRMALRIWKDHIFWGVGAGMFGGHISMKFNSPIFNEYNFYGWYRFMKKVGSMDQFWPQVLAETGIIGTVGFIGMFGSVILTLYLLRLKVNHNETYNILSGLLIYSLCFLIYLFGSGFNVREIIFTYFAFVGLGFGCAEATMKREVHT